MIFRNKLIRMDILLLVLLILVLLSPAAGWQRSFLEGAGAAILFLSLMNHIQHYQATKKLY